jgi:hypothetical protein
MTELTTMLSTFGNPWLVPVLLALAVIFLEAERWWTRRRRRHGKRGGLPARLLDGLSIFSAVLCVASALALLIRGTIAVVVFAGELLGWAGARVSANPWILIVPVGAVALVGVAIAFRRGWLRLPRRSSALRSGGRTLKERIGATDATSTPPIDSIGMPIIPTAAAPEVGDQRVSVATISVATVAPARQGPARPEPDMAVASLSMLEQRRRPSGIPPPQSFLTKEPSTGKPRRSRLPLAIVSLVIVAVGGATLFFPQQLSTLLTRQQDATSHAAVPTARSIPTSIPNTRAPELHVIMRVKSDVLNLRARPGTDQQILTTLRQGTEVLLLNETQTVAGNTWVKVRVGEREGWVSQELLE